MMDLSIPSQFLPLIGATCLLMNGCAMGPDFKKPSPPSVSDYTGHSLALTEASPHVAGGEAQRLETTAVFWLVPRCTTRFGRSP